MNFNRVKLFLYGFSQLLFLAANTYFISKSNMPMAFGTSFCGNMVFCFMVKSLAFGDLGDKIAFSIGTGTGCVISLAILNLIGA